jgi:hypothetical protein
LELGNFGLRALMLPRTALPRKAEIATKRPKKKAERNPRPKSNREVKAEDIVTHALGFD